MNNIIEKILEEYKRNDVIVLEATSLSPDVPDIADLISRQVVINTNSKYQAQLPFRLAHELMHIINGDQNTHRMVAYHNYDISNPHEIKANQEAIEFLFNRYSSENNELNWISFMNMYGVPSFMENKVKFLIENMLK
ncbi:ImmA/IrrE family metallo-endopeptidase [Leuconostoc mesenteroides]|uniref:ImmA/IrrE family metallo-endopeptidase n=1 Tax=Leuconostoc mesenteroides TaxID=1245 RepID=UPI0030CDB0F7